MHEVEPAHSHNTEETKAHLLWLLRHRFDGFIRSAESGKYRGENPQQEIINHISQDDVAVYEFPVPSPAVIKKRRILRRFGIASSE
ncbi:MAG TPA: hypothetical protein VF401_01730 [Candidatus Saccharimonadales bacterium]